MTKTKFRPILFSTPMVQAILENRKTMTRRVVKPQPQSIDFYEDRNVWFPEVSKCPYEVDDVLWVRETWQIRDSRKPNEIYYKASDDMTCAPWKPSIFMPKSACRIFLKVKSIKVERLQDISEKDIKNEGVQVLVNNIGNVLFELGVNHGPIFFTKNINKMSVHEVWLVHWAALWCKINGIQSWIANPFVFVYEFKQIEKPLDFIHNGQEAKIPKSF